MTAPGAGNYLLIVTAIDTGLMCSAVDTIKLSVQK